MARSVKIFNLNNLKSLVIYVVIAAVFTAFTVYDISGISKRLPKLEQIRSVNCEYMFDGYEMDYFAYGSIAALLVIILLWALTVGAYSITKVLVQKHKQ